MARRKANIKRNSDYNPHFTFGILILTGLPEPLCQVKVGHYLETKAAEDIVTLLVSFNADITISLPEDNCSSVKIVIGETTVLVKYDGEKKEVVNINSRSAAILEVVRKMALNIVYLPLFVENLYSSLIFLRRD